MQRTWWADLSPHPRLSLVLGTVLDQAGLSSQVASLAERFEVLRRAVRLVSVEMVDGQHVAGGAVVGLGAVFASPAGGVFDGEGYEWPVVGIVGGDGVRPPWRATRLVVLLLV